MAKVPFLLTMNLLILFFMTMIKSSSARNLGNPTSSHRHHNHHHKHHKISFLMQDLLNFTQPAATTTVTTSSHQLPFSKPLGFFPPNRGIQVPESNPTMPGTGLSTQTQDVSNMGLYFSARAALQELESGAVMTIDENLFDGSLNNGSPLGKAQGLYVIASNSEDGHGTSHMMAMTTFFADSKFKDGLRFFGLHRRDVAESHIAVIGGTGKYVGANGYATVKAVELRSKYSSAQKQGVNKLLLFNVYLS